jgi:hypothetical protein
MIKSTSYDILPKVPVLAQGTLLKSKVDLIGTNAIGIDEFDENRAFGSDEVNVEAGTTCMFVEDWQFMASDKTTPMSAWVRCRLLAGEKIIYYTLVCHAKRLWDFETFRGKKRIIQAALNETFEFLEEEEKSC